MELFQAIILGIVEGVTEFLPISSTFHLIWASRILSIPSTDQQKLFEVVIQSGAILAVCTLFFETIRKSPIILKKVAVAFVPTAIIGFLLHSIIKDVFFNQQLLQLAVFIGIGIVFILFEKFHAQPTRTLSTFTYQQALMIGSIQALAVIPGVSRAGIVILGMLLLSIQREEAALFSFLLAVPTILSASLLDLIKGREYLTTSQDTAMLFIGFLVAFFSALVVIRWLITFLATHSLSSFGWYRIIVGLLLLFLAL